MSTEARDWSEARKGSIKRQRQKMVTNDICER